MHVLEEYIWIVSRELWFLVLVFDNHNNRQQQTKTGKLNFCFVFVVGGGVEGIFFFSLQLSPQHVHCIIP